MDGWHESFGVWVILRLLNLWFLEKVSKMIDKYITTKTYYTFNGQEWPRFDSIEGVTNYAKKRMTSGIKDLMQKLNRKVARKRNVDDSYQSAHRFINELSWDDMLEIRREINRQERRMKKLNKLS